MVTPLAALLEGARDLRALARELVCVCIGDDNEVLRTLKRDETTRGLFDRMGLAVAAIEPDWWTVEERSRLGFGEMLSHPSVEEYAELLQSAGAVAHLAVLRTICIGPLHRYYATTRDRVELVRFDPVPPNLRPTQLAIGGATPSKKTRTHGLLLEGTGYSVFPGNLERQTRVVLDFSRRGELDHATWLGDADGSFPIIATIHPWGHAADLQVAEIEPPYFFGVGPVAWDETHVLEQLSTVSDAGIAVLPELCLPTPDALAQRIEQAPEAYPALVVCGSAHAHEDVDGRSVRVNASLTLLNGTRLLVHRKIHPFRTKYLGPQHMFVERMEEQLTDSDHTLHVAAGTYTRLAVVICADLNDDELPTLIRRAGVNLLLVPSLTPSEGAFEETLTAIASANQGVTVIVNGTPVVPPGDVGDRVALVIVGVPRTGSGEQTRAYGRRRVGRCAVGRLDVNRRLPDAMEWQVRDS